MANRSPVLQGQFTGPVVLKSGTLVLFAGQYYTIAPGIVVPAAHAASHAAAGSDPLTISESQVTNLTADLAAKVPKSAYTGVDKYLYGTGAGTYTTATILTDKRDWLASTKAVWDESKGMLTLQSGTLDATHQPLLVTTSSSGYLGIKVRNTSGVTSAGNQAGMDFGFDDSYRVTFACAATSGVGATWDGTAYFYCAGMPNGLRFITPVGTQPIELWAGGARSLSVYGTTARIGGNVSTNAAVLAVRAYLSPPTNTTTSQLGLGDKDGYSWQFGRDNVTTGDLIIQPASSANAPYFTDSLRILWASGVGKFGQGLQVADLTAGLPVRTTTSGRLTTASGPNYSRVTTKAVADSPYSVIAIDGLTLCNAVGGAMTVNLPSAATSADRILRFKKTDASAHTVTIDANGAETIDGALTYVMGTQYDHVAIQCDGTQWWVI